MKEDLRAFYSYFFLFEVGKQKGLAKTEMSMRLGVELQGHAHYVK
jgi:hypothetical protein